MENKQYYKFVIDNSVVLRGMNSINNVEIQVSPYRGAGNTTRAINVYIQQLFDEGMTCLVDPFEGGRHTTANKLLMEKFKERMLLEHRHVKVRYLIPSPDTNNNWYAILGK